MRSAKAERHAKALAVANADVGAKLPGRAQHGEGEQVGSYDKQRASRMHRLGQRGEILDRAQGVGILGEHRRQAGLTVGLPGGEIGRLDTQTERFEAGAHDGEAGRMAAVGDHHPVGTGHLGSSQRQGFGAGGAFIEQRGIRHVEPGEIGDEGLEVEQGLEPALADLGLVGRVGRVPSGILQQVALDHRRREGVVIAQADEAAHDPVAAHEFAQLRQSRLLVERGRQLERLAQADRFGHDLVDEGVERVEAETLKHGRHFSGGGAKVAGGERGGHGKPPLELETCRVPNPNLEIHQPCTCRP